MNDSIDEVLAMLDNLVCDYGVYQIKLDLSQSTVMIYFADKPFCHFTYSIDTFIQLPFTTTQSQQPYPTHARIRKESVTDLLGEFAKLSVVRDQYQLCAAAFNIYNGLVELSYANGMSCQMSAGEFLYAIQPNAVDCALV